MMVLSPAVMEQLNALQSTTTVSCPRNMVGRIIGKSGETIKALQQYTGAMIQIDQSQDPTRVTIAGDAHSLRVATSMVKDIVEGNFKGFAMLRQMTLNQPDKMLPGWDPVSKPQPVYIQGYGFVPPSQFVDMDDANATLAQTLRDTAALAQQQQQQGMPGSAADVLASAVPHSMAVQAGLNAAAAQEQQHQQQLLAQTPLGQAMGLCSSLGGGDRSPATRRLFAGGAAAAAVQRAPTPEMATSSSSFPAATATNSAPTSPQNMDGTSAGMAPFDFKSAPVSPHTSALDLASYSLSPRPGSLPAGFNPASMGALAAQQQMSAPAQQALGLMGGEDFLSASAGIAGLSPENAAALQALGMAAAAQRLGLDSSVASHFAGQPMAGGPRSSSLGALGTSGAAGIRPEHFSFAEALAKGSPASSFNSSTSLFSGGGPVPALPGDWVQLSDPEGRHFYLNIHTRQSQWEFLAPPTA